MKKQRFILFLFTFYFFASASAQTWNNVTHSSGMQTTAGVGVTVSTTGIADAGECFMTYSVRSQNPNVTSSYLFRFSKPVSAIKINFAQFSGVAQDTVGFYINGSKYMLSMANLFAYAGLCTSTSIWYATAFQITSTGNLQGNGINGTGRVQLRLTPNFGIDSILLITRLIHKSPGTPKLLFDFAFAVDTTTYIRQPYTDTLLCTGDSLKLKYQVTGKFNTGNIFTAQLSDATGSFTSPVNIGTRIDTLADTIRCRIPVGTTPGTGYRIRIVASNQADTSYDNGVNIKIRTMPQAVSAGTNSPLCSGNNLNLNGSSSTAGVSWNWAGPGGYFSAQQSPVLNNVQTNLSGTYILTVSLDGCIVKDTEQVSISQSPITPVAASNSPVCAASALLLTATNTTAGATYNWTGPAFGSTQQNPVISPVQLTHAGNYTVTATLGPCSSGSSTSVVVNIGPSVSAYPNPNDTICVGNTVNLVALPSNGGPSPTYQWFKNGNAISGATTTPYPTSAVNTGDIFYVQMTAGTACNTPLQSNNVKMTVSPVVTPPTISIASNIGSHVWPYVQVSFTATPGNAGANPGYQWQRNGKDIPAANASTWSSTNLKTGDTICCIVTSNFLCAVPREVMSNCIVMNVDLSVESGVRGAERGVRLYPNPNDGSFILETSEPGILYISNLHGQSIGEYKVQKGKNSIVLPNGMADGIYMGRFGDSAIRIHVVR